MKTYFEKIEDCRQQWKIKYNLVETIIITIAAVTVGAEHWNEIQMYCKAKEQLLREKLHIELKNGIPSEDTFHRIFAIINPKVLEKCFVSWAKSINPDIDREIISLDGKTLLLDLIAEKQCDYVISLKGNQETLHEDVKLYNDEECMEIRYFISSVTDVKEFARAVGKHWGIENSLHWCLDVNFNEDRCRMRMDNSGENFAVIRHIAMNLYKSTRFRS